MAFADFQDFYHIIAGCILMFGAVFNMIRYCGGHKDVKNDEPMLSWILSLTHLLSIKYIKTSLCSSLYLSLN